MLSCINILYGQLSVRPDPTGLYTNYLPELVGFDVENSGVIGVQGKVKVELYNVEGELIIEGHSSVIELQSGLNDFPKSEVSKFRWVTIKPGYFVSDLQLNIGDYMVTVKVEHPSEGIDLAFTQYSISVTGEHLRSSKVFSKENSKKVTFHGYGEVSGQLSTREQSYAGTPANFVQLYVNPTLTLFDVPVSAQFQYSSQQQGTGQDMNMFSVDFDGDRFRQVLIGKLMELSNKNAHFQKVAGLKDKADLNQYKSYDQVFSNSEVQKELVQIAELDSMKGMVDSLKTLSGLSQIKDKYGAMGKDSLAGLQHWKDSLNIPDSLSFLKDLNFKDSASYEAALSRLSSLDSLGGYKEGLQGKLDSLQGQVKALKWLEKKKEGYEKLKQQKAALEEKLGKLGLMDSTGQLKNPVEAVEKFNAEDLKDSEKLYGLLNNSNLLGKFQKVLYYVKKINIGTSYPRISDLSLNNQRVNGVNVELTPKKVFVSFTYGDILDPVYSGNITQANYRRTLTTGTLGYGDPGRSHIYLTVLHARDDTSSINPRDSIFMNYKLPQSNYVLSTSFQLNFFKDKLRISGELAGSQTVKDLSLSADSNFTAIGSNSGASASDWFTNIFTQRDVDLNTVVDFAVTGKVEASLFKNRTLISAGVKRIGANYRSFGVPFMVNDLFSVETRISQRLWKNRIQLMGMVRRNSDNLSGNKLLTTSNFQFGFEVGVNIPKGPRLKASYIPLIQSNDSTKVNINVLNVTGSYQFKKGNMRHVVTGAYIMQDCSSQESDLQFNAHNVLANYVMTLLKQGVNINVSGNYIRFISNTLPQTNSMILSVGVGYNLFKIWNNSVGSSLIYNFQEVKYGFWYQSSISFLKVFTFHLRLENNQYQSYITNPMIQVPYFSEFTARAGLGVRW